MAPVNQQWFVGFCDASPTVELFGPVSADTPEQDSIARMLRTPYHWDAVWVFSQRPKLQDARVGGLGKLEGAERLYVRKSVLA